MPLTPRQEKLAIYRELVNEARDRAITNTQQRHEANQLALEAKSSSVAGVVSTWQTPPAALPNYERVAREGYGGNEIIYSCIEELCTSAAEPKLQAFAGKQLLEEHPILNLLANPNPFMTGYDYIASTILYRSIAGNVYTELVYNNIGSEIVQLWIHRPDRFEVLPDPQDMVGGYRFRLGTLVHDFPVDEIMHYKIRNPIDHRYGLAPMSVLLERTDTDNFARQFTKAFFYNSGVPSTLLAFKSMLDEQERNMIQSRFRRDYTGSAGWHSVMVTEDNEVDVKQLGMPMGARGIAYPELDEINEARLCMVFGVPPSLVGARLGVKGGSYANRKADSEAFWNNTLAPIYREIEANFNAFLVPHFKGVDYVKFDLSTVNAFQDETDVQHARWRNNYTQSLVGFRESRMQLGIASDPADDDIMLVPSNMVPVLFKDYKVAKMPLPPPSAAPFGGGASRQGDVQNENGNNRKPDTAPQVPARAASHNDNQLVVMLLCEWHKLLSSILHGQIQ